MFGWPQKNKYVAVDESGQPLFHLREDSSVIDRMLCGPSRKFEMRVFDRTNREVLRLRRPREWWMSVSTKVERIFKSEILID